MSKIKNVFAGLGVVTGFGLSILPMAAYAAPAVSEQQTVTANINAIISMRMVSSGSANDKTMECSNIESPSCSGEDQIVRTTILPGEADKTSMYTDIYVSTNAFGGFTVTVKDSDNDNTLRTTNNDTIAAISSEPVGTSNPGWAIKIDDVNTWYAVPAANASSSVTVKDYTPNPAGVSNDVHVKVTYGVAASSSQATGIYHDTVTYTATARI